MTNHVFEEKAFDEKGEKTGVDTRRVPHMFNLRTRALELRRTRRCARKESAVGRPQDSAAGSTPIGCICLCQCRFRAWQ